MFYGIDLRVLKTPRSELIEVLVRVWGLIRSYREFKYCCSIIVN
jgi:hypothetical protein